MVIVNVIPGFTTKIKTVEELSSLVVYPNLSRSSFYLETSFEGKNRMKIFNMEGKEVFSGMLYRRSQYVDHNLNPGTYLLRLINSQGVLQKKLLKR